MAYVRPLKRRNAPRSQEVPAWKVAMLATETPTPTLVASRDDSADRRDEHHSVRASCSGSLGGGGGGDDGTADGGGGDGGYAGGGDDDDDDDDVDLSLYDVGGTGEEEPAEAEAEAKAPAAPADSDPYGGGWPPVEGQMIEAQYQPLSAWRRARVVRVDGGGDTLCVTFDGYHDVVPIPLQRAQPAAHGRARVLLGGERLPESVWAREMAASRQKCEASDAGGEVASAEEARVRQECLALLRAGAGDDGGASAGGEGGCGTGTDSKGFQLLARMGWKPGDGLGSQGEGETRPVAETLPVQRSRHGLGHHAAF